MAEQRGCARKDAISSVELHFTLDPSDYVRAMRAFLWYDTRVWIVMVLIAAILAGGIANVVMVGELNLMGLFLLLFPLVLTVYLWWGWPASIGRRAQRDRRLRSPATCQVDDEQFVMRNVWGESCLEWEAFARFVESKSHYLLVYAANRRAFIIIPRRVFASAKQEAAFREVVGRHLSGLRN